MPPRPRPAAHAPRPRGRAADGENKASATTVSPNARPRARRHPRRRESAGQSARSKRRCAITSACSSRYPTPTPHRSCAKSPSGDDLLRARSSRAWSAAVLDGTADAHSPRCACTCTRTMPRPCAAFPRRPAAFPTRSARASCGWIASAAASSPCSCSRPKSCRSTSRCCRAMPCDKRPWIAAASARCAAPRSPRCRNCWPPRKSRVRTAWLAVSRPARVVAGAAGPAMAGPVAYQRLPMCT
jgi:hypothetical protein